MISLNRSETIALFTFLKKREEQVHADLLPLLTRIERELYSSMSIEDVERLACVGNDEEQRQ